MLDKEQWGDFEQDVVAYRKKNFCFYFEFAPICTIFAEI